jgi:V8-like Glu-specific endopeptidase
LVKDRQSTIRDVANGIPVLYRVLFPVQNPLPKLIAIYYNGMKICTGTKDVGEFVTTITLDHTLHTGLVSNPGSRPSVQSQPQRPVQQQNSRPQSSGERSGEFNFECGTPHYRKQDSIGLVVNGKAAVKGQFPWLIAYYHNGYGESGFICGASLVSTKVAVTAAHCIHNKRDDLVRKPEEALFYLGKYFLNSQPGERDVIISGVSKFVLHPNWSSQSESFDGDIAIAVLLRTIQFTNFIQPICLWTQSKDYKDIVNSIGIVAG